MAGLTESGFEVKSFDSIKEELENSFDSIGGSSTFRKASTSPVGQLIGIETKQLYDAWQLANDTYQSRFPDTAQGRALDQLVSLAGLERKFGFKTSGNVYLSGTAGTTIPKGTLFSTESEINFVSQEAVELEAGTAPVIRILKSPGNLASAFTIQVSGGFGDLHSSIEGRSKTISFTSTALQVIAGMDDLFNESGAVSNAVVTSESITITFSSARFLPIFTVVNGGLLIVTNGFPDGAAVGVSAINEGAVVVRAFQVVNINSPISGLDSVINLTDFVTGRDAETDQELRARWRERVQGAQISSAASIKNEVQNLGGVSQAVVFEDKGEIEVVVNGGDDTEIATAIFNNKPAGVLLTGAVSVTLNDVNGNPKPIYFSRPIIRSFFVRVTLIKGDGFPIDGEVQIRGALNEYVSQFQIGAVLRPTPDMIWALNGIPGIHDLSIIVSEDNLNFSNDPVQFSNRELVNFNQIEVIFA